MNEAKTNQRNQEVERNTHLLSINMMNVKSNYDVIVERGEQLLTCDDYDLESIMKHEFFIHDDIDWSKVDWQAIREEIGEWV